MGGFWWGLTSESELESAAFISISSTSSTPSTSSGSFRLAMVGVVVRRWGPIEFYIYIPKKSFAGADGRVTARCRQPSILSDLKCHNIAPPQCCYGQSSAPFSGPWPPPPHCYSPPKYHSTLSLSLSAAWRPPHSSALPPLPPTSRRLRLLQLPRPAHYKYNPTQSQHRPMSPSRSWLRSRPNRFNTSRYTSTSSRSWSQSGISSDYRLD